MTKISVNINLDHYRDDIKDFYCNGNCLLNYCGDPFKNLFRKYVVEFENDLYIIAHEHKNKS